jgi:predicted DCC family thiol-disulfide oxidoreductase YuxK
MQVFYDASCPLCRQQMAQIKAADRFADIDCIDCSPAGFQNADAQASGITQTQMMQLIYARGANGKWLIGVDAFIAIYQQIGLAGVSKFWSHRLLGPLLRFCYPTFAKYRQPLSRMGITKVYDIFVARAAKRALANRCNEDRCEL